MLPARPPMPRAAACEPLEVRPWWKKDGEPPLLNPPPLVGTFEPPELPPAAPPLAAETLVTRAMVRELWRRQLQSVCRIERVSGDSVSAETGLGLHPDAATIAGDGGNGIGGVVGRPPPRAPVAVLVVGNPFPPPRVVGLSVIAAIVGVTAAAALMARRWRWIIFPAMRSWLISSRSTMVCADSSATAFRVAAEGPAADAEAPPAPALPPPPSPPNNSALVLALPLPPPLLLLLL